MQTKCCTCFNPKRNISLQIVDSLKLVNKVNFLGSSISSTIIDINKWLVKALNAINRLSIIWKSNLFNKIQHNFFFQAAVMSILLDGCITLTLTKHLEEKLGGNYTRMLWVILTKSWKQHAKNQQLYGFLPPISKTTQLIQAEYVRHCWRSKNELVSNVLQWTTSYKHASIGWPTRTYPL